MKKSERSHEAVERAAQWPHEPRKSSIRCYQHYSAPWGSIFPIPTSPFYTVFLNGQNILNFEARPGATIRPAPILGTDLHVFTRVYGLVLPRRRRRRTSMPTCRRTECRMAGFDVQASTCT